MLGDLGGASGLCDRMVGVFCLEQMQQHFLYRN
jgi:hypothetical protein